MTVTMTQLRTETHRVDEWAKQRSSWTLRTKYTLFEGDDYFVISTSDLIQGKNRHSGKTWAKWVEREALIVSARARGNGPRRLNVYLKVGKNRTRGPQMSGGMYSITRSLDLLRSGAPNWVPKEYSEAVDRLLTKFFPEQYKKATERCMEMVGDRVIDDAPVGTGLAPIPAPNGRMGISTLISYKLMFTAYPGYLNWDGIFSMSKCPVTLPMREVETTDIVKSMFGKTRYRKDLVKATAGCASAFTLTFAHYLRRFVPVDWLVEILRTHGRNGQFDDSNLKIAKTLSEICALIPQARRRRFILSVWDDNRWMIMDTIRSFEGGVFTNDDFAQVRTLRQLHGLIQGRRGNWQERAWRTSGVDLDFDIKKSLAEKYHEQTTESGLKIVAPLKAETLREWSNQMSNCISGYAHTVSAKRTFVGGVYRDDKLIANFEITPGKELRQLLGRFNAALPKDVQRDIIDTLVSTKAVNPRAVVGAWGVDEYTPQIER